MSGKLIAPSALASTDAWTMPAPWQWSPEACDLPEAFDGLTAGGANFLVPGWTTSPRNLFGTYVPAPQNPGSANYHGDNLLGPALRIDAKTEAGSLLEMGSYAGNGDATLIFFGNVDAQSGVHYGGGVGTPSVIGLRDATYSNIDWRISTSGAHQVLAWNTSGSLQWNYTAAASPLYLQKVSINILVFRGGDSYLYLNSREDGLTVASVTGMTGPLANNPVGVGIGCRTDNNVFSRNNLVMGYSAILDRALPEPVIYKILQDPAAIMRPRLQPFNVKAPASGTNYAVALAELEADAEISGLQATNPAAATTQPGGWLPRTIYVDDDGKPVDLDEIREAVEEAVDEALEAEQPKQAKAVRRSADRVLARLSAAQTASQKDIQRLRAAIAQSEAALAALDRAIEAQEDEDAAVALLLAH